MVFANLERKFLGHLLPLCPISHSSFRMTFAARPAMYRTYRCLLQKKGESMEIGGNKCKKITKKVFFFLVIQINFVNLCSV